MVREGRELNLAFTVPTRRICTGRDNGFIHFCILVSKQYIQYVQNKYDSIYFSDMNFT